jgi:phosphoserine phosphatase RsbU/P
VTSMDKKIFERFQESLEEQRDNVQEWLDTATAEQKEIRLNSLPESVVEQRLLVLDSAAAKAEDETLGLCEVCHEYIEEGRLEVDYTAKVCIDHFTNDQRRVLEKELELSQKVQKALLPQTVPDLPGLEIAAYSQPARIVGGDYFDFFEFKDGSLGFVVADVMGKGLAASMLMASLQASLRILVTQEKDPCEVISQLNRLFLHNIHLIKFVTLFLARYDSHSRTLNYCNAGHNSPVLISKNQHKWLESTTPAIGLVEDFKSRSVQITLEPSDLLVLYTDGVTEARNSSEEEFGESRLVESVNKSTPLSAKEAIASLRRAVQEFTNGEALLDDTTIVALKLLS